MRQENNKVNNQGNSKESFIFSFLTAVSSGAGIAIIALFLINDGLSIIKVTKNIFQKTSSVAREMSTMVLASTKDYSEEEEDESDPTLLSHFGRTFIYSRGSESPVIEKSEESLPKSFKQGDVSSKSFAVIDLEKDITLLEKDSGKILPIASITKLATAVISKKFIKDHTQIEINQRMLASNGSSARFRLGEKFTAEELLYPLLMVSSNDAAEALAQSYGRKQFIEEMNKWASEIGAYQTYFRDPSGLSPQNVSSVHDLAIITKWILEHDPDIFDITLTKNIELRFHKWTNPTHFLNLTSYAGGKNGYIPEAGRTSVSLWRLGSGKKLYLSILLGSEARDADTLKTLDLSLK